MEKWMYFLMSIGSIFILIYPTESGTVQHLFLGLLLIGIAALVLFKEHRDKSKRKKKTR